MHHRYNHIAAERALKKLATLQTPQQQFYYLRGLSEFVFEDMVMSALEQHGFKIIRNKRYTGDGGIDGRAYLNGQHYLIQSKRYRKYINPAHVFDFSEDCERRKGKGLFVHTGKTGTMSKEIACNTDVEIISGSKLLRLLSGGYPKPAFHIKKIANCVFGISIIPVFRENAGMT